MSVLGIDIGTSYCVLATIQRGAITIVRNDLSERLTPALVSFTDRERLIGEAAQTQIRSNFRNTARNIKQLLGCTRANQADFIKESEYSLSDLDYTDETQGGLAGYRVQFKGEEKIFSATCCMAALLTKLKEIGEKAIGTPVHDVVISVPGYFSETSRQAMLDAAEIAGLHCLRAMNEHAAVALDYGIYRSNTFDSEKASRVVFVGIGHGATNVFVADFIKGELRIVAVTSDKSLGGRDFDREIIKYFAKKFEDKYKINPLTNAKAVLKLEDTATKAKKILSANSEAPFNIECLVEEYDLNGLLTREIFEELCEPYRVKLTDLLKSTFERNGISPDPVEHVEIIGGCTRIPWIQETVSSFFGHRLPLSKTLNMDETVARGCALQAAMLNPRYRVREFTVVDRLFDPVHVSWLVGQDIKTSVLFETGSALGMKKWLTFQRTNGFEIRLTAGASGEPLISIIEPPRDIDCDPNLPRKIKVKARLSLNGIVSWETAQLLIDEEVDEIVKEKRPIEQSVSENQQQQQGTDKPVEQFEEVEVVKKKTKTRRFECTIQSQPRIGYIQEVVKVQLRKDEVSMAANDRGQQEAKEMMNNLESFIYSTRDKLSDSLDKFASQSEKAQLNTKLTQSEDWIYDNPEGTMEMYATKLSELRALSDPIENRRVEEQNRNEAIQRLSSTLSLLRASLTSPEFSHVEPSRLQSLSSKINEVERWMRNAGTQVNSAPLHQDPIIKAKEFFSESETLSNFAKTILVPKPVEPKPETSNTTSQPTAESTVPTNEKQDVDMEKEAPSTTPTDASMSPDTADAPMQ